MKHSLFQAFQIVAKGPTDTRGRVCRKATDLKEMKVNAINSSGIAEKKGNKKLENVVTVMRREFRSTLFKSPMLFSVDQYKPSESG